jgi:hypothetical protein
MGSLSLSVGALGRVFSVTTINRSEWGPNASKFCLLRPIPTTPIRTLDCTGTSRDRPLDSWPYNRPTILMRWLNRRNGECRWKSMRTCGNCTPVLSRCGAPWGVSPRIVFFKLTRSNGWAPGSKKRGPRRHPIWRAPSKKQRPTKLGGCSEAGAPENSEKNKAGPIT